MIFFMALKTKKKPSMQDKPALKFSKLEFFYHRFSFLNFLFGF